MLRNSLKMNGDFWFGLTLLIFSIFLYISVTALPQDVAIFPKVILIIIGATSAPMIIKAITSPKERSQEKSFNLDLIIMILALMVTYYLLDILGFYVTVTFFSIFTFIFIEKSYNKNSYIKGVILSFVIVSVLYALFNVLMNVTTPKGLLF